MININDTKGLVNYLQIQIMKMVDEVIVKKAKKLGYCKIVYAVGKNTRDFSHEMN
jgi:hypothetical protein